MTWGYVAVAAATVVGGYMASESADDAAQSQENSSNNAIAAQNQQQAQQRADSAPYRAAGVTALGQLATENNVPVTSADVMSDPGYKFGLQQGQQATDRKIAAGGGRVSGAAIKAAGEYATNYATTGYNAAYQRRQDRLNRLAALAGIGQTSTNASAASGANSANAISNILGQQGDAAGAAQLAQGNIWGNVGNQLGAVGQRWANSRTPSTSTIPLNSNDGGINSVSSYDAESAYWQ